MGMHYATKRPVIMGTTTTRLQSRNWAHFKTIALFWLISSAIFCALLRMALTNSNSSSSLSAKASNSSARRSNLYDSMATDLERRGLTFLNPSGETSQLLSLSDIFSLKNGSVTPVLKESNPAVRANVLYLGTEYSVPISDAVKRIFGPYFNKSIWFQNSSMYHFSMFHASHHITPIPADEHEIEAEATSVEALCKDMCPLNIVLDRVVLTSTGVLLGCWQVLSGTDPISIRAKLRNALPHAPEKQLYDAAILHTSFARLLGPPKAEGKEMNYSEVIQFFHELVAHMNKELNGFRAVVSELWYVEEYDLLALALNGRIKIRRFQLGSVRN